MMKSAARITRRLILTALLGLALILSLAGLIISSSRDPILGTWSSGIGTIVFCPDGTCSEATDLGTWRPLPGPYYTRNPKAATPLRKIIAGQYGIYSDYISAHQLTPEHFQQALAQNAIHLAPASARVRLYECEFLSDIPPADAPPAPAPTLHRVSLPITLTDGELIMGAFHYRRDQPETWLTRAWAWFRGMLPP